MCYISCGYVVFYVYVFIVLFLFLKVFMHHSIVDENSYFIFFVNITW